jgi:hypothetical protein
MKKSAETWKSILTSGLMALTPFVAAAHGGGLSFTAEDGNHLLDLDCQTIELRQDQETLCSIRLIRDPNRLNWSYATYDSLTLSIVPAGAQPTEDDLRQLRPAGDGRTTEFLQTFDEGGPHDARVSIVGSGQTLLSVTLTLPVTGDAWLTPRRVAGAIAVALSAAIFASIGWSLVLDHRRRKTTA